MKRGTFIFSRFAFFPFISFAKMTTLFNARINKGFKVNSGEARFGEHYKMKGVTLNVLTIKFIQETLKEI